MYGTYGEAARKKKIHGGEIQKTPGAINTWGL
jgi:hypothetical protein